MNKVIRKLYYISKNIYINLKRNNVIVDISSLIARGTILSKYVKIGSKTYISGKVGMYTYIGEGCIIKGEIGKYCSISNNVKVINGTHPIKYISTSPVFYSTSRQCGYTFSNKQQFEELLYADKNKKIICNIGNDVWIGENVTIKGGITIGDGAIIGMGAVVLSDIPPYCIYAGIPAKKIGARFEEEKILKLLDLKWWDKEREWIEDNKSLFIEPEQFFENIIVNET